MGRTILAKPFLLSTRLHSVWWQHRLKRNCKRGFTVIAQDLLVFSAYTMDLAKNVFVNWCRSSQKK